MLHFESFYWSSSQKAKLASGLKALGFSVTPSRRDKEAESVYFGPDSLEIVDSNAKLSTLGSLSGNGVVGLGLESFQIVEDYNRLGKTGSLEKPRKSQATKGDIPEWFGFSLPDNSAPGFKSWVVMDAPPAIAEEAQVVLPITHPNTVFGIEAVHMFASDAEPFMEKLGQTMNKAVMGIQMKERVGKNEIVTAGRRIQGGERFFDALKPTDSQSGIFMITFRVADLEVAEAICKKAGVPTNPCLSRDGFVVELEGLALRFVRTFWKRYTPPIKRFYPEKRRPDNFRPLGGTFSTSLDDGFEDNWKY